MMRRPAFALIEVLVVLTVIGLLMSLSIAAVFGTLKTFQTDGELYQRLRVQADLAERFRGDVWAATATAAQAADFAAGPDCLLLRGPGDRVIAYRWADGALSRYEIRGQETQRFILPVGPGVTGVSFDSDGKKVTLKVTENRGRPDLPRMEISEWTAPLGGDWQ